MLPKLSLRAVHYEFQIYYGPGPSTRTSVQTLGARTAPTRRTDCRSDTAIGDAGQHAVVGRKCKQISPKIQKHALPPSADFQHSFRSVCDQLNEFDQSQQNNPKPLHKSNSSLTLSGELTSGFYSAETIHAPTSPTKASPAFRLELFAEAVPFAMDDVANQADFKDWEDGSILLRGIQSTMQDMSLRIVNLRQENSQMHGDIVRLKEERASMEEMHDVS